MFDKCERKSVETGRKVPQHSSLAVLRRARKNARLLVRRSTQTAPTFETLGRGEEKCDLLKAIILEPPLKSNAVNILSVQRKEEEMSSAHQTVSQENEGENFQPESIRLQRERLGKKKKAMTWGGSCSAPTLTVKRVSVQRGAGEWSKESV